MHQIKIHMNNTLRKKLRDLKEMDQTPNLTQKNKPAKPPQHALLPTSVKGVIDALSPP